MKFENGSFFTFYIFEDDINEHKAQITKILKIGKVLNYLNFDPGNL